MEDTPRDFYQIYSWEIDERALDNLLFPTRLNIQTQVAYGLNVADSLISVRGVLIYIELFDVMSRLLHNEEQIIEMWDDVITDKARETGELSIEDIINIKHSQTGLYWTDRDAISVFMLLKARIYPSTYETDYLSTLEYIPQEWNLDIKDIDKSDISVLEQFSEGFKKFINPNSDGSAKVIATHLRLFCATINNVRGRVRDMINNRGRVYSKVINEIDNPEVALEEGKITHSNARLTIEVGLRDGKEILAISDLDDLYNIFETITPGPGLIYSRLNLSSRDIVQMEKFQPTRVSQVDSIFKVYDIGQYSDVRRQISVPVVSDNGNVIIDDTDISSIDVIEKELLKVPIQKSIDVIIPMSNPEYRSESGADIPSQVNIRMSLVQTNESREYRDFSRFQTFFIGAGEKGELEEGTVAVMDVPRQLIDIEEVATGIYPRLSTQVIELINKSIPNLFLNISNSRISSAFVNYRLKVPFFNMLLFYTWIISSEMQDIFVPRMSRTLPSEEEKYQKMRVREIKMSQLQAINDSIRLYIITTTITSANVIESIVNNAPHITISTTSAGEDLELKINISNSPTIEITNRIKDIINSTIAIFLKEYNNIREEYSYYGNYFDSTLITQDYASTSDDNDETRNTKAIRAIAPDLLVGKSHSTCSSKLATYVDEENIPYLENQGYVVMEFPPLYPIMHFYAKKVNDKSYYPGATINYAVNSKKYPYMPCVYGANQMTMNRSPYNEWKKQIEAADRGEEYIPRPKLKHSSFETPGKLNSHALPWLPISLSTSISTILNISTDYKFERFVRVGVPFSINSALHAVLYALNDKNYLESSSTEDYVSKVRLDIANKVPMEVAAQELYGLTSSQIRFLIETFPDDDVIFSYWFDMTCFVRLVEEYFNINILMFRYNNSRSGSAILVPRYDLIRLTRRRDRPIVILIEVSGKPPYRTPQYNAIAAVNKLRDGQHQVITKFNYNPKLMDIDSISQINWSITEVGDEYPEIKVYRNLSQSLDIYELIKDLDIVSQQIDGRGKCRAVNINYNGSLITVGCNPIQPLAIKSDKTVYYADIDVALQLFGRPQFLHITDDYIDQLLYARENIIYIGIPINPVPVDGDHPMDLSGVPSSEDVMILPAPKVEIDNDMIIRYKTYFYLQYLLWIMGIAWRNSQSIAPYLITVLQSAQPEEELELVEGQSMGVIIIEEETFEDIFTVIDESEGWKSFNMVDILDFTNINAQLPEVETIEEAIEYLKELDIGLIFEDKLLITSPKMVYSVAYHEFRLMTNYEPEEVPIPNIIYDTHTSPITRNQLVDTADQKILKSVEQVKSWIHSINSRINTSHYKWINRLDIIRKREGSVSFFERIPPGIIASNNKPIIYMGDIYSVGNPIMVIVQPMHNASERDEILERPLTDEEIGTNSLIRSYNAGRAWIDNRINIGGMTSNELDDPAPADTIKLRKKVGADTSPLWNRSYMMYTLIDGQIKLHQKHIMPGDMGKNIEVPHILKLNELYHSAILPLTDIRV